MEYLVDEVVHSYLHNQVQDIFVDLCNRAHLGVIVFHPYLSLSCPADALVTNCPRLLFT